MSIGKRIAEAAEKSAQGDPESALISVCIAIDATSAKLYGKSGRSSYKKFVHDNFALITKVAFGNLTIGALRIGYAHPDIDAHPDGLCSIEEIIYHVVRCGLLHTAELHSSIRFTKELRFVAKDGILTLPSSFVVGLIVAVVACPVNSRETSPLACSLTLAKTERSLNELWGKRDGLEKELLKKDHPKPG
jgi:hypothetical protein